MNNERAYEISSFASLYSCEYDEVISFEDLKDIAKQEDVNIILDHYEKSFEGLTICDEGLFYIHIDLDNGSNPSVGRGKFTIAHELGHCLITEHRVGLLSKTLDPHISIYLLGEIEGEGKSEIELEADYFASCLLMPESIYISKCNEFVDQFSFVIIDVLSAYFSTSWFATLLRYPEVGTIPVFLSFCRDGNVCWYKSGSQFPDWAFKFKVHQSVPSNTLISDVFKKGIDFIGEIREVDRDDWFHVYNDDYGTYDLFEQCYYLKSYDYIVSMLWFEKQK